MTKNTRVWLPSLLMTAVLAACGGGGDSAPATPTTPATPAALKVSGTTAVGAALAGASVAIQCASGSATATADAAGVYSSTLAGGALPCVLTATSADGSTVLHSVVPGTGTAEVTANVTPLTELLVAALAQNDPAAFVSGFTSGTAISAADLAAAQMTVLDALTAAGLNTSAITDVVGGAITAGSGAGYDGVLDALQVKLSTAGVTLSEVATAVATSTGDGATTVNSTLATALAPASSSCAGLKSGAFRVIDFDGGTSQIVTFDASALTATDGSASFALTPGASACDFTLTGGTRMLVARSGLAVLLDGSGPSGSVSVVVPEQELDLAALAGVYNRVQYGASFDASVGDFGTVTFDGAGRNTASVNCGAGVNGCAPDTSPSPFGHLVANADGGFDYIDEPTNAVAARVYPFRTPAGKTMLIVQEANGTVGVLTPQDALPLPEVDTSSAFWQFRLDPTNGLVALADDSVTVTAVDAANNTVTRAFGTDGHTDVLSLNQPFAGMRSRAAGSCRTSGGATFTPCAATVQLPFGGLTLSVPAGGSAVTGPHAFTVSVQKP